MKKAVWGTALAVGALTVGLVACGPRTETVASTASPEPPVATSQPDFGTPAPGALDSDDVWTTIYLNVLRDDGILPAQTDQFKLDMGQMVCGEIAKGKGLMSIASKLQAKPYKLSAHDAGYVYGDASNTICRHVS